MTGSWVVFVFIGDSITAGYQHGPGSLPPRYYPFTNMLESTIRMRLKERGSEKDVAIENRGMDGDSTSGMVNRFTMSVTPEKPEYVVIMGGLNDLFTRIPDEDVYRNLVHLTQMSREIGAEPIMLSTTPIAGARDFNSKIMDLNGRVRRYCMENDLRFIDLFSQLSDEDVLTKGFSNDGVHLSDRGYRKIISILAPLLLELIEG
jgi:lysophospholipase L1-like esterase